MQFEFNESKDKFLCKLQFKTKECSNDFIYECPDEHHINIGFQRLGHSGGRWFIAEIICENNHTTLKGSFKDTYLFPQSNSKNRILKFLSDLLIYIIMYLIFLGIFYVIGLIISFNYVVLYVLPVIIIFALRLNRIYEVHKNGEKFIDFMINEIGCKYTL